MNKNSKFFVFSFYRFIILNNLPKIKKNLDLFLENKNIKGTILVSKEGINGSISGSKLDLQNCIRHLKKLIKIQKLEIKANSVKSPPFKKLKVRLKKEIVSLAKGRLNVSSQKGKRIEPSEWDKFIINKNAIVIDVRNKYEIEIGSFSNTINPETKNFGGNLIVGQAACDQFAQDFPCIGTNMLTGPHNNNCLNDIWKKSGCTGDINERLNKMTDQQKAKDWKDYWL